jgi:methionine aminotransferase
MGKVAAAVSSKTRLIIINTPHNPTSTVLRAADMQALADIVRGTDILILSDEVYEHMVYDGHRTSRSAATRTWRRALCRLQLRQDLSRHRLEDRLRGGAGAADGGVPQGPPVQRLQRQHADAARHRQLHGRSQALLELPAFYQRKRDLFRAGLKNTRFELLPADGTYFQCVRYDKISTRPKPNLPNG